MTKGILLTAPRPAFPAFSPSQIRIIDLDITLEFVAGIALAHDLHKLLLDEPSGVPLHAQLSGELEGGDVVLGARNEVDGQEPLDERGSRLVENCAGSRRGLHATARALEDLPCRRVAVLGYPAVRAHKAVGPTHLDERSLALLIRAIAAVELHEA